MSNQSHRTKRALINFGIPNSEYIVRVDTDTGEALSCYNQDTNTEYIGGGGGGGSDFSIAHVTITGVEDITLPFPCILNYPDDGIIGSWNTTQNVGDYPYPVILYKGKAYFETAYIITVVSGDAEFDEQNRLWIIKGDCTLNVGAPT